MITATYTVPFTTDGAMALRIIAASIDASLGENAHVDATSATVPASAKKSKIVVVAAKTEEDEAPKRGRGRPRKEPVEVVIEEDEFDLSGEDDEEDEAEDDEEPAEKPAAKKKAAPVAAASTALTLEGHIIPAFQKYADKHSREKAGKILAKYKVKSVRDLPKDKYADVLQTLKV